MVSLPGNNQRHAAGFTLVELLVVIAVIALLGSLLLPALGKAKGHAKRANEVNSARQLMIAWRLYADDHDDRVLPGYRYGFEAKDPAGNPIGHPINARYPWRLAPYLGNSFDVMYANENRPLLEGFRRLGDPGLSVYAASVFPSLGVNSVFVGGDDLELPPEPRAFERFGNFCVLRTDEIQRPAELLAFVSARGPFEGKVVNGFYLVKPPYLMARRWSVEFNPADGPEAWGHVHPRFNRHAVAAMTDGHVQSLDVPQLQDMRRWANPADRPDWTLQRRP
jgi:prepilin-type N-terminal cleavage/methylation domain-containing protein